MPDAIRPALLVRRQLLTHCVLLLAVLTPLSSSAGQGVIELNQTCAVETGCTSSDAPGFPITLDTRGSYVLTSGLEVSSADTNGIEISDDDITLDFAGFTLAGPGNVPIATHVCSQPGTGTGIVATGGAGGFVAKDGHVRGMGKDGIAIGAQNGRIERMIVERNCGDAITLGVAGLVIDSQVRANKGWGIIVSTGSRVRDSVADQNGGVGILAGAASIVTGCAATTNGLSGISIQDLGGAPGGVIMGNSAFGNGWSIGLSGISVPAGGIATHNSVVANQGTGITANASAGVGLNSVAVNGGVELSGGTVVGCNALDGVKTCP